MPFACTAVIIFFSLQVVKNLRVPCTGNSLIFGKEFSFAETGKRNGIPMQRRQLSHRYATASGLHPLPRYLAETGTQQPRKTHLLQPTQSFCSTKTVTPCITCAH